MREINQLVDLAKDQPSIVPGFNVFGHEDAQAIIRAAERANSPVILMLNHDARQVMQIQHWGALLNSLAARAKVPVGIHLDHCQDLQLIAQAIESDFTSVMYDGSNLPLSENIRISREIVTWAHPENVAVEGEVGTVPYSGVSVKLAQKTTPEDAVKIHEESGLDWLAVSVGNVHRLLGEKIGVDFARLQQIEKKCPLPLVIHGASGLIEEQIIQLKSTHVAKMNFGTVLRYSFGQALREEITSKPEEFDRLKLMKRPIEILEEKAHEIIQLLATL